MGCIVPVIAAACGLWLFGIPAIRSDPRDNILIAPEYGVSDVTIGNVKRRKTWNHIP